MSFIFLKHYYLDLARMDEKNQWRLRKVLAFEVGGAVGATEAASGERNCTG
jgi:hypothetical protein